jgi:hypothetical protein
VGSNPTVATPETKRRAMMQFTKVDEDKYEVTMNLDTISRIAGAFADQQNEGQGDKRDAVLGASFSNAHERLSQPETSDEPVEAPESE